VHSSPKLEAAGRPLRQQQRQQQQPHIWMHAQATAPKLEAAGRPLRQQQQQFATHMDAWSGKYAHSRQACAKLAPMQLKRSPGS
jgi:hypothetical protein